uniref:Regulator of chromosome condensation 1 n=1 Tax=Neogobius melanostomus TaxID=47308 RepID=A0A8C6WPR2_9GOBI
LSTKPKDFYSLDINQVKTAAFCLTALRVPCSDGEVFSWGQDSRGQLGLGKSGPGATSPQPVKSLSELPLEQVAAGGEHSLCLTVSGGVFSWGRNCSGQLGLGDHTVLTKVTTKLSLLY